MEGHFHKEGIWTRVVLQPGGGFPPQPCRRVIVLIPNIRTPNPGVPALATVDEQQSRQETVCLSTAYVAIHRIQRSLRVFARHLLLKPLPQQSSEQWERATRGYKNLVIIIKFALPAVGVRGVPNAEAIVQLHVQDALMGCLITNGAGARTWVVWYPCAIPWLEVEFHPKWS